MEKSSFLRSLLLFFLAYKKWYAKPINMNLNYLPSVSCPTNWHHHDLIFYCSAGRCDLQNRGGATSASSCCSFCSNTKNCKAFTFLGGTCFMKSCSNIEDNDFILEGAVSGFSTLAWFYVLCKEHSSEFNHNRTFSSISHTFNDYFMFTFIKCLLLDYKMIIAIGTSIWIEFKLRCNLSVVLN